MYGSPHASNSNNAWNVNYDGNLNNNNVDNDNNNGVRPDFLRCLVLYVKAYKEWFRKTSVIPSRKLEKIYHR